MIVCRFSSLDIIYVKPMKKKLVRLKGTMLCSLMNFTEKCNVLKISNYRFLFLS